jgi:glycosyltransferase involved in cell wall biosynthesis
VDTPLVSIGLPCYNRPEGLRHALECLTKQTYKNIEIIVSDNGSPDPKVQWVGYEFAYKDPRVYYYRRSQNMGGMYNVHFVIQNSHGKYFMFASDDDSWDPKYVELLVKEHESDKNILFSASGVTLFDLCGSKLSPKPIPEWFNKSRFHAMLFIISSHHWKYTKANMVYGLYKKEFLKNFRPYEGCPSEIGNDVLTIMRILSKGKIKYIPQNLMKKGFVKLEKNILGHFHILGPIRYILNKTGIKKYPQHDGIDEFTNAASQIISESKFTVLQEIYLKSWNQINRIRMIVLF